MLRGARHVRDPEGREWTVGIRWLPRRPKWRGWGFGRRAFGDDTSEWWRGADVPDPETFLIVVGVLIVTVVAWFLVFPVLFFLLDVVLLVVIGAGAITLRVLFRRPWLVDATSGDEVLTWPVVGWRASNRRVDAVAAQIERGLPLDQPASPEAK